MIDLDYKSSLSLKRDTKGIRMSRTTMQVFAQRLVQAFEKELTSTKYTWRSLQSVSIDRSWTREVKIVVQDVRQYDSEFPGSAESVLYMRQKVANAWACSESLETRIQLARFVIETWGGIRNSPQTIHRYVLQAPEVLCKGSSGISSKSKLLAAIDPKNYFVYDSRIYVLLNYFLSHTCCNDFELQGRDFPRVQGRSRAYKDFVKSYKPPKKHFTYIEYCMLIKELGLLLGDRFQGDRLQLVEMALFNIAKEESSKT